MTTDELRTALTRAGRKRAGAQRILDTANDELAQLLAHAIDSDELTMTDAVDLAGIGRTLGYKLVRERVGRNQKPPSPDDSLRSAA